jgi:thiamine transporter
MPSAACGCFLLRGQKESVRKNRGELFMSQRERTLILVEGALVVALGALLNLVKFSGPWAAGGSVSLEMVPIIVFSLRRGMAWGMFAGFVYGIVNFIMGPYFMNIIQFLLDYGLAFLLVGTAGIARIKADETKAKTMFMAGLGTVVAGVMRFLSHYVSGIVFYASNAPHGQPVALYSLIYNGTYMGPSVVADLIVILILAAIMPNMLTRRS